MKFEITFGDTIRKLREGKGLPLREVADVLQIDTSTLGKIEKNSRKPNKAIIEKCAAFFEVSEQDLMVAFLSDSIVQQIQDAENASEILKVAEDKVEYLKSHKNS